MAGLYRMLGWKARLPDLAFSNFTSSQHHSTPPDLSLEFHFLLTFSLLHLRSLVF